ncbi:MAG TPA: formate dehydrogenase accessory sulfurtransferase FdhD [Gemmatimonadales bacterium]|nr:formate dehydrogenase accessory sulfurtransferase FdhD [Gemmatimonadales bacterium]
MPTAPDTTDQAPTPGRRGRGETPAAVEEVPVWLEINHIPAVTWMCTPEFLEELVLGWLFGEGYVNSVDQVHLRPCATDLGFWADVPEERLLAVAAERRRPVLASGCGAVSTFLADPASVASRPLRGHPPGVTVLRERFKELFARGTRYQDTGGVHAAALTDGAELFHHAEDIGRHNAVDKVLGAALLARRPVSGLGLLVTGRISAELAYKAARAELAWVATPSVPSTLAVEVARRSGMVLVGRAVSGTPQVHLPAGAS